MSAFFNFLKETYKCNRKKGLIPAETAKNAAEAKCLFSLCETCANKKYRVNSKFAFFDKKQFLYYIAINQIICFC